MTTPQLNVTARLRLALDADPGTAEHQLRVLVQDAPSRAGVVLVVPAGLLVQPSCQLLAGRVDLAGIVIESSAAATVRSWYRALRNGGRYER